MKSISTIVVPTDFSAASLRALTEAVELAESREARIHLVHVLDAAAFRVIGPDGSSLPETSRQEMIADARKQLEALGPQLASVAHDCSVRMGYGPDEIVALAQEVHADLIVMGTHGRRGLAHAVLGSTTEKVIRRARCPVLAVRQTAEASPAAPVERIAEAPAAHRGPVKVRDIMRRDVVRVGPDTPVTEVVDLMIRHDVSGLPVVDEQDNMLGYIPESHLLVRTLGAVPNHGERTTACGAEEFVQRQRQLHGKTAREIMRERHEVITINEAAEMTEAIQRMLNHGVSRLPVLRRSKLVGYLTRADILRTIRHQEEALGRDGHVDDDVTKMVRDALLHTAALAITNLSIRTDQGVVWLSGAVSSLDELKQVDQVVGRLPGVKSVANCLVVER